MIDPHANPPPVESRRYLVRGHVQGVGFRWFVLQRARALDLQGWVRNTAEGHVELLAHGRTARVERLARALEVGPPGSHVESVERIELDRPPDEDLGRFEIR